MAWKLLFGSDFGLLSLLTIVAIIGIGVYFYLFFRRKIAENEHRNPPA
jgi:predicted exporter